LLIQRGNNKTGHSGKIKEEITEKREDPKFIKSYLIVGGLFNKVIKWVSRLWFPKSISVLRFYQNPRIT